NAARHGVGERAEPAGRPARDRNGHRYPHRPSRCGEYRLTKYGVVGSQVNLTSRIQSCTTGGQTLISEATRREVGPILKLGRQMEVRATGIEYPITVSEVLGIGRPYQLYLPDIAEDLVPLAAEVPLTYLVIDSNQAGGELYSGALTKLSRKGAEARVESAVDV